MKVKIGTDITTVILAPPEKGDHTKTILATTNPEYGHLGFRNLVASDMLSVFQPPGQDQAIQFWPSASDALVTILKRRNST